MIKTILIIARLLTECAAKQKTKNKRNYAVCSKMLDDLKEYLAPFEKWLEEESLKRIQKYKNNDTYYMHKKQNDGLSKEIKFLQLYYFENKDKREIETILGEQGYKIVNADSIRRELDRLIVNYEKT